MVLRPLRIPRYTCTFALINIVLSEADLSLVWARVHVRILFHSLAATDLVLTGVTLRRGCQAPNICESTSLSLFAWLAFVYSLICLRRLFPFLGVYGLVADKARELGFQEHFFNSMYAILLPSWRTFRRLVNVLTMMRSTLFWDMIYIHLFLTRSISYRCK